MFTVCMYTAGVVVENVQGHSALLPTVTTQLWGNTEVIKYDGTTTMNKNRQVENICISCSLKVELYY